MQNWKCRKVCEKQEDNECSGCPIAKAFDRLAAYENTGLEPDEIISLCDMDRRAQMVEMLRIEERYWKSIDRLKDSEELVLESENNMNDYIFIIGMPGKCGDGGNGCESSALSRVKAAEAMAEKAENIARDLCDDFIAFVTGGVPNAALYCSNRRPECVDGRGWCDGDSKVCNGFFPKAAVWKES